MLRINVLVAATSPIWQADTLSGALDMRPDVQLVHRGVVTVEEAAALLAAIPPSPQCALVLVGPPWETAEIAERWLAERADLVVLHVDVVDDIVRITLRDPSLDSLLAALRGLVERAGTEPRERVAHIQLRSADAALDGDAAPAVVFGAPRPLLQAAVAWARELLREAVRRVPDSNGDLHGLALTRQTVLEALDGVPGRDPAAAEPAVLAADAALNRALAEADVRMEPLAAAACAFGLSALELRLMVLALAPELDHRLQRAIGFLLDEMGRRVGTLGLYSVLLGAPIQVRDELGHAGALDDWLVFERYAGRPPAADEPLRVDPFLAHWLLGTRAGLADDPHVRRAVRALPWPGTTILDRLADRTRAAALLGALRGSSKVQWRVFGGGDAAGWCALLELGAAPQHVEPIRVVAARLAALDALDLEESARRLGRMARLTEAPLIVDATGVGTSDDDDAWLRRLFAALGRTAPQGAIISDDPARVLRLLGAATHELVDEPALSLDARIASVRTAASGADAWVSEDAAEDIARRSPLAIDGLEHAMRLARSRPLAPEVDEPAVARFTAACRQVATRRVSELAELIEPVFDLDDVVLPADQRRQLSEIVDHVQLAPQVLDEWQFGAQLPYGRGVTALFHGPSGVGKTMAALGIARRLGVHVLRLDLSRIESKFIGDTPKNIDRAFRDAEESGAAILIDEAEALLGKRSEVKDAHDRYANIEVAYLLQRMEAYEGLAILTSNLRQNIDAAFLRRLRFILAFPRPDAAAREQIWRQCLPAASHAFDDATFRHVARKIEVTGGHIRQITLRAAFGAAAAGTRITLEHVAYAAQAELAKLGRPPVDLAHADGRRAA